MKRASILEVEKTLLELKGHIEEAASRIEAIFLCVASEHDHECKDDILDNLASLKRKLRDCRVPLLLLFTRQT